MYKRLTKLLMVTLGITLVPYYIGKYAPLEGTKEHTGPIWFDGFILILLSFFVLLVVNMFVSAIISYIVDGDLDLAYIPKFLERQIKKFR